MSVGCLDEYRLSGLSVVCLVNCKLVGWLVLTGPIEVLKLLDRMYGPQYFL